MKERHTTNGRQRATTSYKDPTNYSKQHSLVCVAYTSSPQPPQEILLLSVCVFCFVLLCLFVSIPLIVGSSLHLFGMNCARKIMKGKKKEKKRDDISNTSYETLLLICAHAAYVSHRPVPVQWLCGYITTNICGTCTNQTRDSSNPVELNFFITAQDTQKWKAVAARGETNSSTGDKGTVRPIRRWKIKVEKASTAEGGRWWCRRKGDEKKNHQVQNLALPDSLHC